MRLLREIALLVLLLAQPSAWAAEASPPALVLPSSAAPGFSLELALGKTAYQSSERNAVGTVTNRESGSLPRVALTGRWRSEGWFADAGVSVARHDVAYEGYTQIGIPLSTTTQLAITQGSLVGGHSWRGAEHTQWQASVGVERLQVSRNILPGLGSLPLREVLTSTRAVAGLALRQDWPAMAFGGLALPFSASVGVDVMHGLQNRLEVDSYGLYDPITLRPSRGTDWRLKLKTGLALSHHASVWLGLEHESFQPGSSSLEIWNRGGVPSASVRYPGSRQLLRTVSMGVGWAF